MKIRMMNIAVFAALLALAILYGICIMEFRVFPYRFLKNAYQLVHERENESPAKRKIQKEHLERPEDLIASGEIPREYFETNVDELISIRRPEDVGRLRDAVIALLWGKPGLPSALPSAIEKNFRDSCFDELYALNRIDKLIISMEFGLESHVYHFIPKAPNNRVILYHKGHEGDFFRSKYLFGRFLNYGYHVYVFSMPLFGPNNRPTVYLPRIGRMHLTSHDQLKLLSPENGHPLKYFIEPVVVVLNHLCKGHTNSSVAMIGISGGGWTTTLAAAVDTRIKKSFPIAGSYPLFLRSDWLEDWSDYESTVPEMIRTANYLELYILGASGPGRNQLQIYNRYDACCYAGMRWKTYKDIIKRRVSELGPGAFDVFSDSTHRGHMISDTAMNWILSDLRNTRR